MLGVKLGRAADRIQAEPSAAGVTLTIDSASGIGGASVEPSPGGWPSRLSVRLRLRGLESLKISNSADTIRVSMRSTPEISTQLVRLGRDGTEEPLDPGGVAEIALRPADGGGFQVQIPQSLLAVNPARITLEWIDFYR